MTIPLILVLWEHPGFGGRRRTFVDDTRDLNQHGFNDRASAVGVHPGPGYEAWKATHGGREPTVTLFEHPGFGGAALTLTNGAYANLDKVYAFGDAISSVRFNAPPNAAAKIAPVRLIVELFRHPSFQGERAVIIESVPDLRTYLGTEWNDVTSSVRVRRGPDFRAGDVVKLLRDPVGPGAPPEQLPLGPGDYADLRAHNFDDVLTAIQLP